MPIFSYMYPNDYMDGHHGFFLTVSLFGISLSRNGNGERKPNIKTGKSWQYERFRQAIMLYMECYLSPYPIRLSGLNNYQKILSNITENVIKLCETNYQNCLF